MESSTEDQTLPTVGPSYASTTTSSNDSIISSDTEPSGEAEAVNDDGLPPAFASTSREMTIAIKLYIKLMIQFPHYSPQEIDDEMDARLGTDFTSRLPGRRARYRPPKAIMEDPHPPNAVMEDPNPSNAVRKYHNRPKSLKSPRNIHSTVWVSNIKHQSSLLLNLPVEIRRMIWIFALTGDENQTIEPARYKRRFKNVGTSKGPQVMRSLSLTCRQTYVEVVGGKLLYHTTTLLFIADPKLLVRFMAMIGPVGQEGVRFISIRFHHDYPKSGTSSTTTNQDLCRRETANALFACKGLEKVSLHFLVEWYPTSLNNALETFDTVFAPKEGDELAGFLKRLQELKVMVYTKDLGAGSQSRRVWNAHLNRRSPMWVERRSTSKVLKGNATGMKLTLHPMQKRTSS